MTFLFLIGYTVLLLVASIIPDTKHATDPLQNLFTLISPTLQNLLHIPAYGGLAWLWCNALNRFGTAARMSMALGVFIAVGYGIAMEVVQLWVPGRFPSAMDAGFNFVGAGIGGWIWRSTYHPFSNLVRQCRGYRSFLIC